jgi:hypothetical protein
MGNTAAMSSPSARERRLIDALLSDPPPFRSSSRRTSRWGSWLVLTDYVLNDEGLLTYYWASWARREFVPVFFSNGSDHASRRSIFPPHPFGVHPTLIAHVVVASLSIRCFRRDRPVARASAAQPPVAHGRHVAALLLRWAGRLLERRRVVGLCLVVYLLSARHRPLLAGMVAGVLPWVRPELLLFCAAIALYGIFSERDRRLLAGMPAFPLLYVSAGAWYHNDPLWILHFPPSMPVEPGYLMWEGQLQGARYFLEPLLAVTPLAPVLMALRPLRLPPIERVLLIYFVVAATLINVLPLFHLANFGTSPRYSMFLLPAIALLAGRVLESWWAGERPGFAMLVAVLAFAVWLATRQQDSAVVAVIILTYVILLAAVRLGYRTTAIAVAVALMAAEIVLPIRRDVGRAKMAPYLDPMAEWLSTHADQVTGPVVTNSQLLAPFLESRLPGLDVRFLAWTDVVRDLMGLSNPANGQQDRIRHLCDIDLYGRMQFGPIAPGDVPPDTLLALRAGDIRLPRLLPEAAWSGRLEVLEETPLIRIARVLPPPGGAPER